MKFVPHKYNLLYGTSVRYINNYDMNVFTGVPRIVSNVVIDSIIVNGNNVTLALSWEESFNNFNPIVNYTVSCSGDVTCPPNFTTTDNTTRSYTITNLTSITTYTFSVVATNSIGSGEAGVVMITTPGKVIDMYDYVCSIYVQCPVANLKCAVNKYSGNYIVS